MAKKTPETNREKLQAIRKWANAQYGEGTTPEWIRAWIRLADTADMIDAMIARTEVK